MPSNAALGMPMPDECNDSANVLPVSIVETMIEILWDAKYDGLRGTGAGFRQEAAKCRIKDLMSRYVLELSYQ